MSKHSVAIESLKPSPHNPRKPWSGSKEEQFSKSLVTYGDLSGVILNITTGNLVGGHKRVDEFRKAAKVVIEKEPCKKDAQGTVAYGHVVVDGNRFAYREVEWTLKKEKQANLAANQWSAEWDTDALEATLREMDEAERALAGFTDKEISDLDIELAEPEIIDAEPQIDHAAELNKKWKVKRGDLFQIGDHRLLCGDSTLQSDVKRLMGGGMADMCFTDPPWNVAIGQQSNPKWRQRVGLANDDLGKQFPAFLASASKTISEICSGDVYVVMGSGEWPAIDSALRFCGFHWSATIIWVKNIHVIGRSNFHRRYEPIWYGWMNKIKSSFNGERTHNDVWEFDKPRASEEHPTMKPVELVSKAVQVSSKKKDIIADPFLGSGTTMVAAQNLSRLCYGIEISPDYCAVILQRMQEAFNITGKRINS